MPKMIRWMTGLGMVLPGALALAGEIPWIDYLIPLPKEIEVQGEIRAAPEQVHFELDADASEMILQAIASLRARRPLAAATAADGAVFTLRIGRLREDGTLQGHTVPDAGRLRTLPNFRQAYLIRPDGRDTLLVAAWDDPGVFYGIQTLAQLLAARAKVTELVIPRAVITDWPDFDERGIWSGERTLPIPWLASYKLNFARWSAGIRLHADAPAECPPLPMERIRDAETVAFKIVPHASHYDFWYRAGVNERYPEIVGHGDSARHPFGVANPEIAHFARARCPCASHPKFQELVTDWVRSAAQQGAREISLWLSEFAPQQCGCETCLAGPRQWVQETRVSIAAIQAVRAEYPDLTGRIFFTLRTSPEEEQDSEDCLALFPVDGIRVEKAYGPNNAFDAYAAAGHWTAAYGLSFQGSYDFRARIAGYLANGYSAVYAIGANDQVRDALPLAKLAEWTWHVKGRDEHALHRAFATRRGYADPEAFARWMEVTQPLAGIQRRLHNTPHGTSVVIMPALWDAVLQALAEGEALPVNFPGDEALTGYIDGSEQAVVLAQAIGEPALIEQSMFLRQYFHAIRLLAARHAAGRGSSPDREAIAQANKVLLEALRAALEHRIREAETEGIDQERHAGRFRRFLEETGERLQAMTGYTDTGGDVGTNLE